MPRVIMEFEELIFKHYRKFSDKPAMFARMMLYILMPVFKLDTINSAAQYFGFPKDRIYRALNELSPKKWLNLYRSFAYARLFEYLKSMEGKYSAYKNRYRITLSCDDTGFIKSGKKMPLVGYIWSGLLGKSAIGTGALYFLVEIGDQKARFPLDFRLYRGRGGKNRPGRPSKNRMESVLEMLKDLKQAAQNAGVSLERIVFVADSWFSSEKIYDALWEVDIPGVVKGKKSFVFNVNGKRIKASCFPLHPTLFFRSYDGLPGKKYARLRGVHDKFGDVILTIVICDDGSWYYLISTEEMHTSPKVIQDFKKRWSVEVFFRDSKQCLNLGIFQFSKKSKIYAHFALRGFTYQLLDYIRTTEIKRSISIGNTLKWLRQKLCGDEWIHDIENKLLCFQTLTG